ncbi:MAG: sugar phosphate nucleotidyltransferase [Planctomycetota bacterium]|nr:sugar phosphate nucleotidyltransferase [Planctomycetota bacterium]
MDTPEFFSVLLAGGSGARFWPASRRSTPKQLLQLHGERSLLQETWARQGDLVDSEHILIVTSEELTAPCRDALPVIPASGFLSEPVGRNTAASVAWAAVEIAQRNPRAVMAVLPADHVISSPEAYRDSMRAAIQLAANEDVLVTFGIQPTHPATGYGYIEAAEAEDDGGFHEVKRFVEKPDAARAQEFMDAGSFLWNSGMFVWRAEVVIAAFRKYAPALIELIEDGVRAGDVPAVFANAEALPVDKAILEHADNVRVLPISWGWNDLGAWTSLSEVLGEDADGNCAAGAARLLAEDSKGCTVFSEEDEHVALLGVEGLVVVRSKGVTLVCPAERAQEVRKLVDRLSEEAPELQ